MLFSHRKESTLLCLQESGKNSQRIWEMQLNIKLLSIMCKALSSILSNEKKKEFIEKMTFVPSRIFCCLPRVHRKIMEETTEREIVSFQLKAYPQLHTFLVSLHLLKLSKECHQMGANNSNT